MILSNKNRKIDELLILASIILIFTLTFLVFEKVIPSTLQTITGKVITTVNITQAPPANCGMMLNEDLNLVSFFCIPTMIPTATVVGSLSNLEAIFEYQENGVDPWKIYNPHLPSFVIQDLNEMSRTKGYWVRMRSNESFFLEGKLRLPSYVYLVPGWNLVGYPTNEIKTINESFASIYGKYTEVRAYNSVIGSFISYVPGIGGALNQTEAGRGYWINVTREEVWVVE